MSFAQVQSRLLQLLVVIVGACVLSFTLTYLTGDPAALMLPADATPEQVEQFRQQMGFDRPALEQFTRYLTDVATGNWGTSIRYRQPVLQLIVERVPATVALAAMSLLLACLIGFPLGILAATRSHTIVDRFSLSVSVLGQAIPPFWLGLMLMLFFSVRWRLFPSSGFDGLRSLVLPSLTLAAYTAATIVRLTRLEMVAALNQDYTRTARAKGLHPRTILFTHVLRNAALPVITFVGLQLGQLLAGAVVTETIFSWPGMGLLLINAIYQRDFPLVRGITLMIAILFAVINLLVDLLYAILDPRAR